MGVYYSTTIAYGFPPPPTPDDVERWEWWEDSCPEGFQYAQGGDLMNGEDEGAIFALPHHIKEIFNSGSWGDTDKNYGVHRVDGFIEVNDEERERVIAAARQLGVDDQHVGFYVLSSVG